MFNCLFSVPYSLYKVRLWQEGKREINVRKKRIGALVCRTKEGGENTINYLANDKQMFLFSLSDLTPCVVHKKS